MVDFSHLATFNFSMPTSTCTFVRKQDQYPLHNFCENDITVVGYHGNMRHQRDFDVSGFLSVYVCMIHFHFII